MDVLLDNQVTGRSSDEYAAEVADRLEEAYRLAREQLGAAAVYSKGWYDRKVKQQLFEEGEAVRVLDQRGHPKRTPKWQLPYSQVGNIIRRLNDVTYIVMAPAWKRHRILHVDKLRHMESASSPAGPGPIPARADRGRSAAPREAAELASSPEGPDTIPQAAMVTSRNSRTVFARHGSGASPHVSLPNFVRHFSRRPDLCGVLFIEH